MAQTCGNVVVHLISSTKQRLPIITPEIRPDLFAYLGGIIREMRGTALIINGPPTTFTFWRGFGQPIPRQKSHG